MMQREERSEMSETSERREDAGQLESVTGLLVDKKTVSRSTSGFLVSHLRQPLRKFWWKAGPLIDKVDQSTEEMEDAKIKWLVKAVSTSDM